MACPKIYILSITLEVLSVSYITAQSKDRHCRIQYVTLDAASNNQDSVFFF